MRTAFRMSSAEFQKEFRLPSLIYPDNRLKIRIRHARLVLQLLFGSGTESLHCGKKHLEALRGDVAAKVGSARFTNAYPLLFLLLKAIGKYK